MNDLIKVAEALEDSNMLLNGVNETIKNKTKEEKGGFLTALLGTLRAALLGNMLTGKVVVRAGSGRRSLNPSTLYGKGAVRAGYANKIDF